MIRPGTRNTRQNATRARAVKKTIIHAPSNRSHPSRARSSPRYRTSSNAACTTGRHDHLRDALAVADDEGLVAKIDQQDPERSAIVAVDRPGRVRQRYAVLQRQPRPRPDLHLETVGDFDRSPVGTIRRSIGARTNPPRALRLGQVGADIRPRGTRRLIGRQGNRRIGPILAQNPDRGMHSLPFHLARNTSAGGIRPSPSRPAPRRCAPRAAARPHLSADAAIPPRPWHL